MPGRYAVEVLQPCFDAGTGPSGAGFRLGALGVIGLAAGVAATRLFRWESGVRIARSARLWVAAAMAAWISVGWIGWQTGRLKTVLPEPPAWANITEAQIAEIRFDDLPGDHDLVAPLATAALNPAADQGFAAKLRLWPQKRLDNAGQSIRNLVAVAAVADLCADPRESEIARLVFRQLGSGFEPAQVRQSLAWIILSPEDGQMLTKAPELGLFRHPPERLVRQRSVLYAKKYLGRLLGRLPDR
jgi:ABC-2 type transport system permease protein